MRQFPSLIALGFLILGVPPLSGPALALGLTLTNEAIVFPDGTEQTTAAVSEVENFFMDWVAVAASGSSASGELAFQRQVPEGYRALIEFVSVQCDTALANPMLSTALRVAGNGGVQVKFHLPMVYQGSTASEHFYTVGLATRLYAESSQNPFLVGVRASIERVPGGSGLTSCRFAITGRYFPIPRNESPL